MALLVSHYPLGIRGGGGWVIVIIGGATINKNNFHLLREIDPDQFVSVS